MKLTHFILLAVSVLLSACQTTSQPQNPQLLSQTHGLLFVHFPRLMPRLTVRSVKGNDSYSLETDGLNKTARLWLPPGEYVLDYAGFGVGGTKLNGYPHIQINTGQMTSLGGLINFGVGEGQSIWLAKSFDQTETLANDQLKQYANLFKTEQVIRWAPDFVPRITDMQRRSSGQGLIVDWLTQYSDSQAQGQLNKALRDTKDIDTFYALAVKSLPPFARQAPAVDDEKSLYYGADLGQIKKRTTDGVWTTLDTGALQAIAKVYWFNGKLIAAGYTKTLYISEDKGQSFKVLKTFLPAEIIVDIDSSNDHLYVLTTRAAEPATPSTSTLKFEVIVYKGAATALENLAAIKSIPHAGVTLRDPKAELVNNRYYVGLEPKQLKFMNIDDEQWFDIPTPQKFTTFNVSDNEVITLFNIQGAFSDLFISTDRGQHWQELNTPSYVIEDIFFNTTTEAISHRTEPNAFTVSFFVQKYLAGADKWQNITKAPDECKYMVENEFRLATFCVTKSDTILSFKNSQWVKEDYK